MNVCRLLQQGINYHLNILREYCTRCLYKYIEHMCAFKARRRISSIDWERDAGEAGGWGRLISVILGTVISRMLAEVIVVGPGELERGNQYLIYTPPPPVPFLGSDMVQFDALQHYLNKTIIYFFVIFFIYHLLTPYIFLTIYMILCNIWNICMRMY